MRPTFTECGEAARDPIGLDRLVLTDPRHEPSARPGPFARLVRPLLNDERDVPFAALALLLTATALPSAIYLSLPGRFSWWLATVYLAVLLGVCLGPFVLMLHNTSHRPLYRPRYGALNLHVPWVLGPLFGLAPHGYYAHHIGMHHPESNLGRDLSSTMPYQRDSAVHFVRYLARFFVAGGPELVGYLWRRRRLTLVRRLVIGEAGFYLLTGLLLLLNWRAALVIFLIPFVAVRVAMMSGNWAQHAFVDAADPGNSYRNSITCINCGYNRRCFNDGYHIGHHLKPRRHWTEMPADFDASRGRYVREGAIVFAGIDFFGVWLLLMLRRYDRLARHYVNLGPAPLAREEIVALLRARTRRIEPPDG